MTIPQPPDDIASGELDKQRSLRRLNRAYGCYAFIGVTILVFLAIASAIPEGEAAEGYGMMMGMSVGAPLMLGSIIAFVAGIVLTLGLHDRWHRHRPLVIVCLTHVLFMAGAIGASSAIPDEPGRLLQYALYALVGIYIAIAVLVPGWWFTIGRRKYRDHNREKEDAGPEETRGGTEGMNAVRRDGRVDLAYACFAFVGLITLAAAASMYLSVPILPGPLSILASLRPLAFLAGIVLTVMCRRHRVLVIFCLGAILLQVVGVIVSWPGGFRSAMNPLAWLVILQGPRLNLVGGIFIAFTSLVPAWWFTMGRRSRPG
jgi:hypothetical protein